MRLRSDMLWRGGQGKVSSGSMGFGQLGHVMAVTARFGMLSLAGRGQLRRGGQGAARRVKFWSVGARSGESRLI